MYRRAQRQAARRLRDRARAEVELARLKERGGWDKASSYDLAQVAKLLPETDPRRQAIRLILRARGRGW